MDEDLLSLIDLLELQEHPEGGYYRETFRAFAEVTSTLHSEPRTASTAIYFLLPAQTFSALHRVRSDEVWHHYDGDPLEIHTIDETGEYTLQILGKQYIEGQRPQIVVPAGVWQAARPRGSRGAFCGCTVAPGFDFNDFELPTREELQVLFPKHRGIIHSLTRH
jgi:predicted cupin superfamily sugar epimerase